MSSELGAFLRRMLDDDERTARLAVDEGDGRWKRVNRWDPDSGRIEDSSGRVIVYDEGAPDEDEAEHIARHDPARVITEVEAKRRIVDEHQDVNDGDCGTCVVGQWGYPTHGGALPAQWPCATLKLLALPYADHPGYREEWRPDVH